jgi:hypothetical protein
MRPADLVQSRPRIALQCLVKALVVFLWAEGLDSRVAKRMQHNTLKSRLQRTSPGARFVSKAEITEVTGRSSELFRLHFRVKRGPRTLTPVAPQAQCSFGDFASRLVDSGGRWQRAAINIHTRRSDIT